MKNERRCDKPPPQSVDVLIIGAGIAGLGLACALAPYGLDVLIVEKRREAGGIHRGDSLLPKATALLERWGALSAIREAGARPVGRLEMHHPRWGKIFEAPLTGEDAPSPYLVLPHARIEEALTEVALRSRTTRLLRCARVTALHMTHCRDRGAKVAGVRYRFGGAEWTTRAKLVVACDGQKSHVRRELGVEVERYAYDHAYLGLEADRPASYGDAMRVHLHRRGGVLLMPRADRVGVGVLVEAGSAGRWAQLGDDALAAELRERAPILEGMRLHREGAHVYTLTRSHAERYVAKGAVILGDAAHTTNPTAGQGMAMALTDAGALADRVGPAVLEPRGGALALALADYERVQHPANAAIVGASHWLAVAYGLRGPVWHGARSAFLRALGSTLGETIARPIIGRFLQPDVAPAASMVDLAPAHRSRRAA